MRNSWRGLWAAACGFVAVGCGAEPAGREESVGESSAELQVVVTGLGVVAHAQEHACAILEKGAVRCWGENSAGQLGYGDTNWRGNQPGEMGDSMPFVSLGAYRSAVQVATGDRFSCALLDNGKVKCWGDNTYGNLGIGSTTDWGDGINEMGDFLPSVNLGSGRTAKSISAGMSHVCAVLDNGSVKCWGAGWSGQLGTGATDNRGDASGEMGDSLPAVPLGTGRTAKYVAAGFDHTCALLDNNTVKCWGDGSEGELGYGDGASRGDGPGEMGDALPVVNLGTGRTVKQLSAGWHGNCAVLDNDSVKCWGNNDSGESGLGATGDRGNDPGEMGDNLLAVDLGPGLTAKQVSRTGGMACAILNNDYVKCWGDNDEGTLGVGDTNSRGDQPGEMGNALPYVALGMMMSSQSLSVGAVSNLMCSVVRTGRVKCWGTNFAGQLGIGETATRGDTASDMGDNLPYVDIGTKRGVRQVVAGFAHACAIIGGGLVKCWGDATFGQLGYGNTTSKGDNAGEMGENLQLLSLGSVAGSSRTAKQLVANAEGHYTCALLDNDQAKCWGYNNLGVLGTGDAQHRGDTAGEMGDSLPFVNLGTGRSAKSLAAGAGFACAILDNNTLKCWGGNDRGQLGQGNTTSVGTTPGSLGDALQAIALGTGRTVKAVTAGAAHACAILDNDTVKCWGDNANGQLGYGDVTWRGDNAGEMGDALPAVNFGTNRTARAIAAGNQSTCVLTNFWEVKCWGNNSHGQLGQGDTIKRGDGPNEMGDFLGSIPMGINTPRAIAAGEGVVCVLRDNGSVACWGDNSTGALGLNTNANRGDNPGEMGSGIAEAQLGTTVNLSVPLTQNPLQPTFSAGRTSCAIVSNGYFKCWGRNQAGQLGIGNTVQKGDHAGEMATIPWTDVGIDY
jgi:alpha-tubulin suppressor-like RCC1 family protein